VVQVSGVVPVPCTMLAVTPPRLARVALANVTSLVEFEWPVV
jgi:hypothetical protein